MCPPTLGAPDQTAAAVGAPLLFRLGERLDHLLDLLETEGIFVKFGRVPGSGMHGAADQTDTYVGYGKTREEAVAALLLNVRKAKG